MKICLVSEEYPPETGWGGIGTHTYNLAHALVSNGHQVSVLSKSMTGVNTSAFEGNLSVHRIVDSDHESMLLKALTAVVANVPGSCLRSSFFDYPLNTLRRGAAIGEWLGKHGPFDIIEFPDYGGEAFWCQLVEKIKVPVTVKLHTPLFLTQRLNLVPENNIAVILRKWMEKYSIVHASKLSSPTRSLSEIISSECHVPIAEVLPYCIDTERFSLKKKEEPLDEFVLLFAGRLERRKGVEVLARAIPLIVGQAPNVRIRMVGRDTRTAEGGTSMMAWLDRFFHEKGVSSKVDFIGEVPIERMVGYYQHASLCVLPSLWENLPFTCLEAMSCGTPVIASNIGGFPEIITDNKDGFLFESQNHDDLAAKVLHFINNKDRQAFGRKARERIVTTYSYKVISDKTTEFYQRIVSG